MARKRTRDGDSSRKAILASARKAFARTGFHGTSVDTIARGAGLSKGAVFLHFKSKENLIYEMLADYFVKLDSLYEGLVDGEKSSRETLYGLLSMEAWDRAAIDDVCKLVIGMWSGFSNKLRRRLEKLLTRTYDFYLDRFADLFRDIAGDDFYKGVNVRDLAALVLAAMDGLFFRARTIPEASPDVEMVVKALKVLLVDDLATAG
jgi:AcrR family transcriptional regulator